MVWMLDLKERDCVAEDIDQLGCSDFYLFEKMEYLDQYKKTNHCLFFISKVSRHGKKFNIYKIKVTGR